MPPLLTYGLLALCGALVAAGFWLGGQRGAARFPKYSRWSLVLQIAAFVGVYLILRPGTGDDPAELSAALEQGRPVFIDVYSNF